MNLAIDFDLQKHFDAAVERIDAREVDAALTPELREGMLSQPRAALYARVQDALCDFRLDRIPAALADYRIALRAKMTWERTQGSLKPPSTGLDEVKRLSRAGLWEKFRWNGFETKTIAEILEPEEKIIVVTFREVVTSKRTIARRDEIFDRFRPISNSREHWMKQCTPESAIAEAEAMERYEREKAARPFSDFSGPNVAPR